MMLIMGLGADQSIWKMYRAAYAEHFQCFAIDNRGIGRTSKPGGRYTTAQMAEDVRAVMDHPDRPRPCRRDFDGWSDRAAALLERARSGVIAGLGEHLGATAALSSQRVGAFQIGLGSNARRFHVDVAARAAQRGLQAAYHPNSRAGSVCRTHQDYDRMLNGLDPHVSKRVPDVGHLAKEGTDPLEIIFLAAPHVPIDATDAEVDEIGRKIAAYGLAVGSVVAPVWPFRGGGSASRGRGLLPGRAGVISRKRCGEN